MKHTLQFANWAPCNKSQMRPGMWNDGGRNKPQESLAKIAVLRAWRSLPLSQPLLYEPCGRRSIMSRCTVICKMSRRAHSRSVILVTSPAVSEPKEGCHTKSAQTLTAWRCCQGLVCLLFIPWASLPNIYSGKENVVVFAFIFKFLYIILASLQHSKE